MRWMLMLAASCLLVSCSKKADSPEDTPIEVVPAKPDAMFSTVVSTEDAKNLSKVGARLFAVGFLREHGTDLTQYDVGEPDRIEPYAEGDKTGWLVYWEARREPKIHLGVEVTILDGNARIRYDE